MMACMTVYGNFLPEWYTQCTQSFFSDAKAGQAGYRTARERENRRQGQFLVFHRLCWQINALMSSSHGSLRAVRRLSSMHTTSWNPRNACGRTPQGQPVLDWAREQVTTDKRSLSSQWQQWILNAFLTMQQSCTGVTLTLAVLHNHVRCCLFLLCTWT